MEMTLDKDIANLSLYSDELLQDALSMDDYNNNDENTSYGSISHEGEEEPTVGMVFDSLDDVWEFWGKYGKRIGFSVRKEQTRKSPKDGRVTTAYYVCSKEGQKKIDKRRHDSVHRWETRTGCLVKLIVGYDRDIQKYKIRKFVKDHNHPLETAETSHMLRSNRKVTEAHGCAIDVACSAGLPPTVAYELMVIEAGGCHNVGYVLEDHKSYLRTRRQNKMAYGELGCIMNYFEQKKLEWPSFYHSVQRDIDEMTTNIFWCDSKMQTDYDVFGDVITFDTTFGTNKEFRPLGAFVGFNNHRQMVIFGAALMYDETIDSFKWLFQTFINAHKQKRPLTIFTDQDAAIMNALQQVLPESHHGLCSWHITKNAKKHMGSYMKGGEDGHSFWRTFQKCMHEIMDEMEFEVTWSQMLKEFKLQENSWLNGIYLLKLMWARCYMKKNFTLGIRSTQLSESFNSNMKAHLKCDINLAEFFTQFDRVVERIRENELEAEFSARQKVPSLACPRNPLLQEAASVYTPAIFKKFQEEFLAANELYIKQTSGLIEGAFVLGAYGDNQREYKVFYDGNRGGANCSCKRWEMEGIFFCHILKAFSRLDIHVIPKSYIVKRWCMGARTEVTRNINYNDTNDDVSKWVSNMTSMMLRATYYASASKKVRSLVSRKYMDVCAEVYAMQHLPSRDAVDMPSGLQSTSDAGKGLAKRTGKKKTKRYKSGVELREGKGKKRKVLKDNREYSSLRPKEFTDLGLSQTSHISFGGEGSGSQSQTSHRTIDGMPVRDFSQNH